MAKKRSEISDEYKWNLEAMYLSDDIWEQDCQLIVNILESVKTKKDTFTESAKSLLEFLREYMKLNRLIDKIYVYAKMRSDEDTSNTYYQTLKGKADDLNTKVAEETSFFEPKLLKLEYNILESFINEEQDLKEYKFYLEKIFRVKPHTLEENEERILSSLSKVLNNPNESAGLLRNADMKFGTIKDESGNDVELNNSNYSKYVSSNSRTVRQSVFKRLYEVYSSFKNTFATIFSGEVDTNKTLAHLKHFNSARESALFSGNIPLSVYDNLIDTVNNHISTVYKYFDLKKEILNLDELHLYDAYAPLINDSTKKYTFDEAKNLVIEALSILGDNYVNDLNKAFDEKWIDVYPNEGKRSGAYSWGCFDSYSYICLNYEGELHDVSTLAHELGHSMHSYYSHKNNPYQTSHYKIFVAEVASTVNELLLYNHMLKNETDKNARLSILNSLMELFKSTIYRQTMFAEFEKEVYEKAESGEVLTHEFLGNIYYKLNEKYFGPNVIIDDEIRSEWSRIPHFYMNFYVYQYATGLSAACYIATKILEGDTLARDNYLEFLKTGGSNYPIEELKIAGVDMNNKEAIESALKMFDEIIEMFKEEYKK